MSKPIFLHGLFRCGSTYVFNKLRSSGECYCYYEPLHHDLVKLKKGNLDLWGYDKVTTSRVSHPSLNKPHFHEYERCFGGDATELPFFNKSLSYDEYYNVESASFPEYINHLLSSAPRGTRPVLQFNRTANRVRWFADNYSDCMNVALVRNPRDQFDSYVKTAKGTFLVLNLIIVSRSSPHNKNSSLTRRLLVPAFASSDFAEEFRHYSKISKIVSLEDHYRIFFTLWCDSFLEFRKYCDYVIDMDRVQGDHLYRSEAEKRLGYPGLFDDCRIRASASHYLPDRTLAGVEADVVKQYGQQERQVLSRNYDFGTPNTELQGIAGFISRKLEQFRRAHRETPVVSIITPSYNQARYVEQTIKSVIDQVGEFYIEYIVMDGLSGDGTVEILSRYADMINSGDYTEINHKNYYMNENVRCMGINMEVVSAADNGQADALNKGFQRSSGSIIGWLNSDDMYYSERVISNVVSAFSSRNVNFVYGRGIRVDENGIYIREEQYVNQYKPDKINVVDFILQPSAFWRRSVYESVGGLREDYHYVFDWEYWVRIYGSYDLVRLGVLLSCYRVYENNKTSAGGEARTREMVQMLTETGFYNEESRRLNYLE